MTKITLKYLGISLGQQNVKNPLTSLFSIGTYETMATSRVETNRHL